MPVSIGFPKRMDYRFQMGEGSYRVGVDGLRTIDLVLDLYKASMKAAKLTWLLAHRQTIDEIGRLKSRRVLSLIVERTKNPRLRLLAIWLRGRCGGYAGTCIIAQFAQSQDLRVRKEVARALKRMSGWVALRAMESDPDERIRRLAMFPLPKSYHERMEKFANHVHAIPSHARGLPLWIAPGVDMKGGKPPKSILIIRAILERIQRLLGRAQT